MNQIKQNLKVAQNQQKSYANQKITPREFKTRDHVYLKVSPKKSSVTPCFPQSVKITILAKNYGKLKDVNV
jgi:hypothetical protein